MRIPEKNMAIREISKSEQFQYENQTWERLLTFFKQENNVLKTRLSEVLDRAMGKDFLALAEQFQNRFILKDEFIRELNHDVNDQKRVLGENMANNTQSVNEKLIKRQDKLRNEVEYLEKDFALLKNEFNKYLSTAL